MIPLARSSASTPAPSAAAGRSSTQGVKLLNLEVDDKVAAVVIPPEESKTEQEPTLLQ